jgi:type II secretory pathway component PulK
MSSAKPELGNQELMRTMKSTMHRHNPTSTADVSRRGAVMLYALVCLMLLSLIGASLLKLATAQRHQVRREQSRMQAAWLAEAGIERAVALLADDADYAGETWELSADDIGGADAASVQIEVVTTEADSRQRTVAVTAEYPNDADRRARVSKQVDFQFDAD